MGLKPSTTSIHNNLANPIHEIRGYSASGMGELLSWLYQVRIRGKVQINVRVIGNTRCMEGIRFCQLCCEYGVMRV
jgi:hypothetical protein